MAATESGQPAEASIQTYHCLCSHLLLATTHDIPNLPRRSGESQDRAHILPSAPVPERISSAVLADTRRSQSPEDGGSATADGVTVVLSLTHASPPVMIRRSDGLEKRYLLQCSRCKLTVGYHLDWAQWEEDSQAVGRKGKRADLIFILPDSLLRSDVMLQKNG